MAIMSILGDQNTIHSRSNHDQHEEVLMLLFIPFSAPSDQCQVRRAVTSKLDLIQHVCRHVSTNVQFGSAAKRYISKRHTEIRVNLALSAGTTVRMSRVTFSYVVI